MASVDATLNTNAWQYKTMPGMDDDLFRQWTDLVEARTGIRITNKRKSFLLSNLSIRMRELKLDDYRKYFELVTNKSQGLIEWETLVDRLTVHETRFWRDETIFELIRQEYIEKNQLQKKPTLDIQVLSVGCATGEEPYSLAIWLEEYCKQHKLKNLYGVHATDISLAALSAGREGIYPANRLTNLPDGHIEKYFEVTENDRYRIISNIKERVCFTKLNLLNVDSFPFNKLDVIVCQNVLIYFKQAARVKLLNQLAGFLKVGGLLILGAGEILDWGNEKMVKVEFPSSLAFRRLYA